MPDGNVLLEARGIVKRFGDLAANDDIDLSVRAGEIHALLGENGAGKSTLVKILYGSLQPDAGSVSWQGRPAAVGNPAEARALGIGMVFQHFSLFEGLTVAENIAPGIAARRREKRPRRRYPGRFRVLRTASRSGGAGRKPGRWASGSASRSSAACCSARACSSWTSRLRC